MKTIGFVVFPGFNLLDFAGPLAAFDNVSQFTDPPAYRCVAISPQGGMVASSAGWRSPRSRAATSVSIRWWWPAAAAT